MRGGYSRIVRRNCCVKVTLNYEEKKLPKIEKILVVYALCFKKKSNLKVNTSVFRARTRRALYSC